MPNNPLKTMDEALLDEGCLTLDELSHAVAYQEEYNPLILAEFIRTHERMSQQMRDFIADVLEGKIKRPKGQRGSTIHRDAHIWEQAQRLKREGFKLRGSKDKDGIDSILGDPDPDGSDIDVEFIVKAIQRVDKYFKEGNASVAKEDGVVVFNPRLTQAREAGIDTSKVDVLNLDEDSFNALVQKPKD